MNDLSRRGLLIGSAAVALTAALPAGAARAASAVVVGSASAPTATRYGRGDLIAYVGSRTTVARNARGAGITVWTVPAGGGAWSLRQTVPADDGDPNTPNQPGTIPGNPSFLLLSRDGRFLYTVHGDDTKVSSFTVKPTDGTLTLLNTIDTADPGTGRNPVHLVVDPTGKWLAVAFLAPPGCVMTLPIGADGRLGPVAFLLELPGTAGPHKTQQLGPNPHHVVFDPSGRWLVIPDRGVDRVFVATLNPATGTLALNNPGWADTREVEGPRHIVFHPGKPLAYVINELRSTLTTYRWDNGNGTLTPLQIIPSTAPTMTQSSRAAAIAISRSGQYVYASNRRGADTLPTGTEPDTIGIFRIRRDGQLDPVDWASTGGLRPRFAGLDPTGRQLFAANELSDTIVGYAVASNGAHLRSYGTVAQTGSPVCIVFAETR